MLFNTFNNFKCPDTIYFTVEMQEPLEHTNSWFCACLLLRHHLLLTFHRAKDHPLHWHELLAN